MNIFPNILAKNQNFKKLRPCFADEKAMITTILISSGHWKNHCTFLLAKEKTWKQIFNTKLYLFACERKELKTNFNTNCELSQNCAGKQMMPSKTTINWLFSDI